MTKKVAFNGKLYAGHSHVWLDEGEYALAEPRRGSLLYNTKKAFVMVCAVAVSFGSSLFAESMTFTLNKELSGANIDWTKKSSYADATRAPQGGDTVKIPSGMTAILSKTDDSSWSLVSSLQRVYPEDGARFEVNVESGEAVLECQISWHDPSAVVSSEKGYLVKTGNGILQLNRRDASMFDSNKERYFDYLVNMDIRAGALKLPKGETGAAENGYSVAIVNISSGAEFYIANWDGLGPADKVTDFNDILGEGVVKGNDDKRLKLIYSGVLGDEVSEFSGSFEGKIWCNFNKSFKYLGTSPNQKTDATRVFNGAILSVSNNTIFGSGNFGGNGCLKFIGENASGFKPPTIWLNECMTISSGNAGGMTLASENRSISIGVSSTKLPRLLPLVLDGENSSDPCVFTSHVSYGSGDYPSGLKSVVHLVKRGSGTWRIEDSSQNQMNGGITVENGILQFTSLAEMGVRCSLGYSTNLYSSVSVAIKNDADFDRYRVPWAFLLGGENTEGIMEYVGDQDAVCSTRPFAVHSKGGIYASSAAGVDLSLSGFSAAGSGEKTLIIGGGNSNDNVIKDVTDTKYSADGKGIIGVEKRGSGTWRLSGERSFTGPLEVKSGTLVVDNAQVNAPFRYFRFYMKENAFSACINETADGYYASVLEDDSMRWKNESGKYWGELEKHAMHFSRLHFFTEDGSLAVSNCTRTSEVSIKEGSLPENTFTFTGDNLPDQLQGTNQDVENMFMVSNDPLYYRASFRLTNMPKLNDPATWACITLRLPDDAPEVFGYDVRTYKSSYDNREGYATFGELGGRSLVSWEVHGSVDGVNFEKLHTVDSFKMWGGSTGLDSVYWAYDQTNGAFYAYSRTGGKFYHFSHTRSQNGSANNVLENVRFISVEPGATLEVHGAKLELKSLKIGENGMGTLKNVKFAEDGKIDIAWNGESVQSIDANIVNSQGSANLSKWQIFINGEKDNYGRLSVKDGNIVYKRSGFSVMVR